MNTAPRPLNPQSATGNPQSNRPQSPRLLLLFTTTGYNAEDFLRAAKKLGVEAVPGTDRCHVLDDPWRDGALPLRFGNAKKSVQTIVKYAEKHPIHAIIAVGDQPLLTAALASKALQLPYNLPEAVEASRNKLKSRKILQRAGLPVPGFASYSLQEEPCRIAEVQDYPCVLKPLALSASQGVIRANDSEGFADAFRRIAKLLKSPTIQASQDETNNCILVEDYVEGQEVALEGLLDKGELRALALSDKPDPLVGPFFEETLYVTPSRLDASVQGRIAETCQQATRALGLMDGPIHAELRVNQQGPWILEVAARSIGGLCSRSLQFGTGMSLEELIIRHSLGMEIPCMTREASAAGVTMIPIPKGGYLHQVRGVNRALAVDGIEEVTITAKIGQKLVPLPEGSSYLGFIFARGDSPLQVEKALRTALQKLHFEISPELPVVQQL